MSRIPFGIVAAAGAKVSFDPNSLIASYGVGSQFLNYGSQSGVLVSDTSGHRLHGQVLYNGAPTPYSENFGLINSNKGILDMFNDALLKIPNLYGNLEAFTFSAWLSVPEDPTAWPYSEFDDLALYIQNDDSPYPLAGIIHGKNNDPGWVFGYKIISNENTGLTLTSSTSSYVNEPPEYTHVAIKYSSQTKFRFYINGNNVGTYTGTIRSLTDKDKFYINGDDYGRNVANVKLYNYALSDEEILNIYNTELEILMPSQLVVFDSSTGPNSSVTGGWTTFITGGYGEPVFSTANNYITMSAPWWQDGQARTVNDIDLTGATSITLVISSYSVAPWYYYSNFFYPNNSGELSGFQIANPNDYNFTERTVTVPITNGGNGKMQLNVTNSGWDASAGYTRIHSIKVNY